MAKLLLTGASLEGFVFVHTIFSVSYNHVSLNLVVFGYSPPTIMIFLAESS
jgi:hypothetical protein